MNEPVRCPVCETETRRDRFPRHFAETHPGDRLRATFAYSATWAIVLPVIALALAVVQLVLALVEIPSSAAVTDGLAAAVGVQSAGVQSIVALGVAPAVAIGVAIVVVALARGPGQRVRRGWQPSRFEYLLVLAMSTPVVGPIGYLLWATRRALAVRYHRELLAGGGVVATEDIADAARALGSYDRARAAEAFEDAGQLLQGLQDDQHFRNPTLGARIGALARGCGMAAAICEHQVPTATTTAT